MMGAALTVIAWRPVSVTLALLLSVRSSLGVVTRGLSGSSCCRKAWAAAGEGAATRKQTKRAAAAAASSRGARLPLRGNGAMGACGCCGCGEGPGRGAEGVKALRGRGGTRPGGQRKQREEVEREAACTSAAGGVPVHLCPFARH